MISMRRRKEDKEEEEGEKFANRISTVWPMDALEETVMTSLGFLANALR